jgi:hypothetical protein
MNMRLSPAMLRPLIVGIGLLFVGLGLPVRAEAQGTPVSIEAVEIWIRHARMSPQRMRDLYISRRGIAFVLDDAAIRRLRAAGATDEMLAMLQDAEVRAPTAWTLAGSGNSAGRSHGLTRSELRWMYYDKKGSVTTYLSAADLQETSGQVAGQRMITNYGSVALESVPLSEPTILGGVAFQVLDAGLMMEGHFQPKLMMLNMGLSYQPFLPIGASGVRIIAAGTPFLGLTRQTIGKLPLIPTGETSDAIELHNSIIGGDVRLGLAYHFRPGFWVSGEWAYRVERTVVRTIVIPGQPDVKEGIPWDPWAARGSMWRIGIGW